MDFLANIGQHPFYCPIKTAKSYLPGSERTAAGGAAAAGRKHRGGWAGMAGRGPPPERSRPSRIGAARPGERDAHPAGAGGRGRGSRPPGPYRPPPSPRSHLLATTLNPAASVDARLCPRAARATMNSAQATGRRGRGRAAGTSPTWVPSMPARGGRPSRSPSEPGTAGGEAGKAAGPGGRGGPRARGVGVCAGLPRGADGGEGPPGPAAGRGAASARSRAPWRPHLGAPSSGASGPRGRGCGAGRGPGPRGLRRPARSGSPGAQRGASGLAAPPSPRPRSLFRPPAGDPRPSDPAPTTLAAARAGSI